MSTKEPKSADRQRALEAAISQIERAYGKGAVMKLDDETASSITSRR